MQRVLCNDIKHLEGVPALVLASTVDIGNATCIGSANIDITWDCFELQSTLTAVLVSTMKKK